MSDNVNQENSDLTAKKREIQMIKRITAAIIAIMRTANLTDIFVTAALTIINVNNEFSKQFKSENIEFFDSELDIEKNIIIINNKF